MTIKIITVGKISLKPVRELIEEYLGRIKHYLSIETANFKSPEDFLKKANPRDFLIVLDEKGKSLTSVELAKWLEDKKLHSIKSLAFLIGPAEGFSEEVRKKADFVLSLSKMTLQHELALVVLLEQIYRACTILKGEPYHK